MLAFTQALKSLSLLFSTASGVLSEKEIIQLLFFDSTNNPIFAYELPLSPSLGEMPAILSVSLSPTEQMLFRLVLIFTEPSLT